MYRVVVDDAREQIAALPHEAARAYADVMDVIEVAPWSGPPFRTENPTGNLRLRPFGPRHEGSILYLIVEHPPEVHVLIVQWLA